MNQTFHVFFRDDCYEILVRDYNLVSIIKHSGNTGMRHEVQFDHLSPTIQEAIIDEFSNILIKDTTYNI